MFQIIWEKDDTMSTRIGMSAFRKPAEALSRHELLLRYRQQVIDAERAVKECRCWAATTICDLVIQNKLASRQHALIEYNFGKFLLTDHSANGTYIRFSDGQVIQLSHQQIVLHGAGQISLGQPFSESPAEVVEYILQ